MKTTVTLILFLLLFLLIYVGYVNATDICGTISSNTTWTTGGSPYNLKSGSSGCTVTVNSGVTLTIQAGVQVKGTSNSSLLINGTLSSVGTSGSPIIFTTTSGTPAPGQWIGVRFGSGAGPSASQLTYVTISYTGNSSSYPGGIYISDSSPTFTNVTTNFSSKSGAYVTGATATPTFTNATVSNNTLYGINLVSSGGINITNSTISNNTDYAFGAEANTRLTGLTGLTITGNGSGNKNSVGYRGGNITTSEVWRAPVIWTVTATANINSSGILTVDPGTTVKFASNTGIDVTGKLTAVGTSGSIITFTSNATTPAPGNWNYIKFNSGANPSASQVSYATISYAGQSATYPAAIYISGSSPTLGNITVSFCSRSGIAVTGSTATPSVSNATITNNTIYGVNLITSGGINLTNSTISNNTDYAIGAEANTRLIGLTGLTITGNGSGNKNSIGYRGGSITTNEVWPSPVTWTVTTTATISSTGTLTVNAGATVKFASATGIDVSGTLTAVGTSGSQITFTSSASTPAPGNWNYIKFNSGANPSASQLSYATISYAGQSATNPAAIYVNGSSPTFGNITVNYSLRSGIAVTSATANPVVTNAVLSNNSIYGVNLIANGGINISNSTISNNTDYAIGVDSGTRLLGLTGITLSGNGGGAKNAVNHRGGTLSATVPEIWKNGIPLWIVTGTPTMYSTSSLTIEPGITVRFAAMQSLFAQGRLTAIGTATSPIIFTSNAVTPAPGDWGYIFFTSTTNPATQIAYASIMYGGFSATPSGVYINSTSPTLDHVTFSNNGNNAIYIEGTSSPTIKNCSFSGSTYGIYNNTPTNVVTARLNYWNASNGPSGVGTGSGLQVSAGVIFEPWIKSAPSDPNYFSVINHQNRTFNPTINVCSGVNFTTTLSGTYYLKIFNNLSQQIRTITGTGSTATPTWDGKNDGGTPQPVGTYTYELSSTSGGGQAAASVAGFAIIDNSMQLVVSNFTVNPIFFSPNGDLIQDTTNFSATFSFYSNWTLDIKNSGGTTVTSTNGQGSSFSYAWNGASQPDGVYTGYLSVTAGSSNVNDSRVTTLDNTMPTAVITSPTSGQTFSNVYQNGSSDVPIIGTASDLNINNWSLEYGVGAAPSSWTVFATGTTNVTNGTIAPWPTVALTNGTHTIRLKVYDKAGNLATSPSVTVTVNNFTLSQNKLQINTSTGESLTYASVVPFQLTETLLIKDSLGQTVKTLFNGTRNAGSFNDIWAGLNEAGTALVKDGTYHVIANIQAGSYSMTWDQSSEFVSSNDVFTGPYGFTGDEPFNNHPPNIVIGPLQINSPRLTLLICGGEICFGEGGSGGASFMADDDCNPPTACPVQYEFLPANVELEIPWAATDTAGVYHSFCGCSIHALGNSFPKSNILLFGRQPKIINLAVTPPLYAPERGNQTISFTLSTYQNQQANITITILNQSSVSVLRNIIQNNTSAGNVNIQWDGKADNGTKVAPGNYTITVIADTPAGPSRKTQILTTIQY